MSSQDVSAIAEGAVFRPNNKPWMLSTRHVTFDELLQTTTAFEERALRRLMSEETSEAVAVVGPSGAGKSSFVAWVSATLSPSHVAIRLPVSGLADPTDTGETLKLSLGIVLDVIELDADASEDIRISRAEQHTASRSSPGITGGKIGGGPIPAQVNVEVGSLRDEYLANKLDGEYLSAVNRIVAILFTKGIRPVFVFEDTEAIVGAGGDDGRVDAFLEGPIHTFVQEIDAPCLIAIQTHLTEERQSFARLAASMEVIEIPHLRDDAHEAIARILQRRIAVAGMTCDLSDVLGEDALAGLVQFYDDTRGDLRKTLAAAHDAADDAAGMGAELIRAAHVRVGAANWI